MVAISKSTVVDNIWKNFKDTIASNVTSVTLTDETSHTIQTYTESFPQSIIDGKSDYPIIIIEPANVSWDDFTLTTKWINGTIVLEVYSTKNEASDRFLDAIIDTIETNRKTFRDLGLMYVNLESTDSETLMRAEMQIHIRRCTFSFRYIFTKTQTY